MNEHEKKYEAIAQQLGIEKLVAIVPASYQRVQDALKAGDEHLNTIPLCLWDKAAGKEQWKEFPTYTWQQPEVFRPMSLSHSERVCVLKHVAKFHLREPEPEPEPVPLVPQEPVDYEAQAQAFLDRHGIKFRATLSDTKIAPWDSGDRERHHYRVTLSKPGKRLVFDFWGSIADCEAGIQEASAYDVLSCISSDAYTPETFEDYCAEFGESIDSIKAKQGFNRVNRFAKRLRAFFTPEELEALAEIQ
jgi:hypothetical protein